MFAHHEDVLETAVGNAFDHGELHGLERLGWHLQTARGVGALAHAGRRDRNRKDRRHQRVAESLRDFDGAVARHDRVAAQHVVRPALLRAARHDQHGRLAFLDLLRNLGMREQLELHDVLDIHRLRRLRERGR